MIETAPSQISIRLLTGQEAHNSRGELTDVLMDCVEGGASIGFMWPFTRDRAEAFWSKIAEAVERGHRALLVARDHQADKVIGTVQVVLGEFLENQPHRGEIAKMIVHRRARKRGIGQRLMLAAEETARAAGKTLLVLDTASEDAERLYERLGWIKVGVIPGFALWPDGRPCATTYYYKEIA